MTKQVEQATLMVGSKVPWRLRWCEWKTHGRTCQVPTGTDAGDKLRRERLCAYHRHRAGVSTYGQYTSDRVAFDRWRATVLGAGPFPRIWNADPDLLWSLLCGEISWDAFLAEVRTGKTEVS